VNICRDIPNLVTIGHKYRALYINAQVGLIVAGDINTRMLL